MDEAEIALSPASERLLALLSSYFPQCSDSDLIMFAVLKVHLPGTGLLSVVPLPAIDLKG